MKINGKKEKNYGIALLRIILCFMVVLDHFYNERKQKKIVYLLYYHIPTFFLISFYYTYHSFATFSITKIKLRFERLLVPYICWSFISWILNNIYFYIFKKKCKHSIYELLLHLLHAHFFIPALWFQNIIILTTLIISIIIFMFKNDYLLIFQIIMILAYVFQYSGVNYIFFKKNFNWLYYNTYGRLVDTFPDSITGFFIAAFRISDKLKKHKLKIMIINFITLLLVSKSHFDNNLLSFKYGGIRFNIAAICIFFIFFYSLYDKNEKIKIKKFLDLISNYTAGIYFSHFLIGQSYIMKFFLGKKIETIFGSLIIYITSYLMCFILDKIIGNTKLKHLIK